jgi:single-strand DNA-binding protein
VSRSVNRLHLIGNVGRDPEVRTTKSGTKLANFTVATDRRVKEGAEARTDWHRCTAWGKSAEFVENYVRQGDRVYVEGRIEYGSYEKDGTTIPTADVQAHEVIILSSREGGKSAIGRAPSEAPQRASAPASRGSDPDDDLPF